MTRARDDRRLTEGGLEAVLRRGDFAITAETGPPDSADPSAVLSRAGCLKGLADAVNVLDGAGARAHLSPLAAAAILARAGIEPVLQFTMRDRNRLALQADVLGAAALGVPSILCLTGDRVETGDQPDAKPVFDLSSSAFIAVVRQMRDQSSFPSGRKIEVPPRLLIGGADAPHDPAPDFTADALRGKIDAGIDFVQTQYCFDMAVLRRYMARLRDLGIAERVGILIGIGPLASARSARWMTENLYGVHVPDAIVRRLDQAADPAAEGRAICVELIQELQDIAGVAGAHLMAPHSEEASAQVISGSGVLKNRRSAV